MEYKHSLYICFLLSWLLVRVSHFSCSLFLCVALFLIFYNIPPVRFLPPTIGLSLVPALVFSSAQSSWSFSSTDCVLWVCISSPCYYVHCCFPFLIPALPSCLHPILFPQARFQSWLILQSKLLFTALIFSCVLCQVSCHSWCLVMVTRCKQICQWGSLSFSISSTPSC